MRHCHSSVDAAYVSSKHSILLSLICVILGIDGKLQKSWIIGNVIGPTNVTIGDKVLFALARHLLQLILFRAICLIIVDLVDWVH